MSTKFPGGLITKTPVTPAGPYQDGAAPGVWTVEQALQYTKQGIWPTQGLTPNYIEDVFSTYLYTGNGSTQTITNGIDLSTYGGMVWTKARSVGQQNWVFDTVRGPNSPLATNLTGSVSDNYSTYFSPNTNIVVGTTTGYSLGVGTGGLNTNTYPYVGWTFRKKQKFFDIVTFTGTGSTQTIAHNLGSVPGCIIVKDLEVGYNWQVYHRSLTSAAYSIQLNQAATASSQPTIWDSTAPTSTNFTVGTSAAVNGVGKTFVAYIYAHNAGGFGLTGTDNVISCGSFTTDSAGFGSVNLGYEPQWLMIKNTTNAEAAGWVISDTMRGLSAGPTTSASSAPNTQTVWLSAQSSAAENTSAQEYAGKLQATGFSYFGGGGGSANSTMIYIAIRRGPMKVPTSGTSVFSPNLYTEIVTNPTQLTTSFPTDLNLVARRNSPEGFYWSDRLRGSNTSANGLLTSFNTSAEFSYGVSSFLFDNNTGVKVTYLFNNSSTLTDVDYQFRRAPSFFDEVCYTGTGSPQDITHNLGVAPELMIVKRRSAAGGSWATWVTTLTANQSLALNTTDDKNAVSSTGFWNSTFPTSSVFSVGTNVNTNSNTVTYVAYLFATCAGVSKVGTYTGTGATQTIDCGFGAGGSRFVLIKRTDSTGDWYVWDSARGMVSGTDPSLLLNSTAAEVNANSVYAISTGFQIVSTAAGINASGGTYIFLSIA